ncbi:hypothetical protein MUP05_05825 [Candidatus Bathyarchaeota archaeon]|nr:hypothetical protein [Candidatus Bathyarchaeota archaeon]
MKSRRGNVKICPGCGDSSLQASTVFDGVILPTRFLCKKCGYSGYIVLEAQEDSGRRL